MWSVSKKSSLLFGCKTGSQVSGDVTGLQAAAGAGVCTDEPAQPLFYPANWLSHPFRCDVGQAEAAGQHLQTESGRPDRAVVLEKPSVVAPWKAFQESVREGGGGSERVGRMTFGGCPQPLLLLPGGTEAGWCGMRQPQLSHVGRSGESTSGLIFQPPG